MGSTDYNGLVDTLGSSDGDVLGLMPFGGYYVYKEKNMSEWVLSSGVRFTRVLDEAERQQILKDAGYDEYEAWQKGKLSQTISAQITSTTKALAKETNAEKRAALQQKLDRLNEIHSQNPYAGWKAPKYTNAEGVAHLQQVRESVASRIYDNPDARSQVVQLSERDTKKFEGRYLSSVTREEVLECIRETRIKGEYTEKDYIPIRASTPPIFCYFVKCEQLPMVAPAKKIRDAQKPDTGYKKGQPRYHGFTAEQILEIVERMGDPQYIIYEPPQESNHYIGRYGEVVELTNEEDDAITFVDVSCTANPDRLLGFKDKVFDVQVTEFKIDGGPAGVEAYFKKNSIQVLYDKDNFSIEKEGDLARKLPADIPFAVEQDTLNDRVSFYDGKVKQNNQESDTETVLESDDEDYGFPEWIALDKETSVGGKTQASLRDDTSTDTADETAERVRSYNRLRADNEALRRQVERLKKELKPTTERTVCRADAMKIAREMLGGLRYSITANDLADVIERIGNYLVGSETEALSYDEMIDMARGIARKMVESAEEPVMTGMEEGHRQGQSQGRVALCLGAAELMPPNMC